MDKDLIDVIKVTTLTLFGVLAIYGMYTAAIAAL